MLAVYHLINTLRLVAGRHALGRVVPISTFCIHIKPIGKLTIQCIPSARGSQTIRIVFLSACGRSFNVVALTGLVIDDRDFARRTF